MPPRKESRLSAFTPSEETVPVQAHAEPTPAAPAAPSGPAARTVGEVHAAAIRALAADPSLMSCWVKGEISGFKRAASGHWYFDLKDDAAVLNGAMFRGANGRVRFEPHDGMEVLVRGKVSVYPARSTVQVVAEEMRAVGQGELALRFEQLRRRLEADGLFDVRRKRALPEHPRRVGIVTSLQAAALRDMVHVATARHPGIQLLVRHARVQGEGAAEEIAAGLRLLAERGGVDVIVVGRGGGSMEDLWAFNEEAVVRAVAASPIPVVSAVGHETDFTLCDFAADRRAATPSNAMEICVPDAEALLDALDDAETRMWDALDRLVPELRQKVDDLTQRAEDAMRRTLTKEREMLAVQAARLDALSPLATLARGYTVTRRDGRIVRRLSDAPEGSRVEVILPDGRLDAEVKQHRPEESR